MPTNSYLPFAIAAGANVWSDAAYNGSQQQQTGQQKGIVPSGMMNKAWRQSSVGTSALGQIIVDHGLVDALDDGNVAALKANLRMSFAAMLAGVAFAVDQSATPNILTVILDPVPPSLTGFRGIFVRVANTNTGPVNLSLNNLGSKGVVKKNGLPLTAGDLIQGQFAHFIYDAVLGQWTAAGSLPSDVLASPAAASTATFTLPSTQSIPNNMNTQINLSGTAPAWGTFSNGTLTVSKGGIYTVNLIATSSIAPSTQTSHATIFFIYANGVNLSQQSAINWTNQTQSIGLSNSYTSYFPAGSTFAGWTYLGNSGTTDVCSVTAATMTVTKFG